MNPSRCTNCSRAPTAAAAGDRRRHEVAGGSDDSAAAVQRLLSRRCGCRVPAMLPEFLDANRDLIIARARARVAARTCPKPRDVELTNGIPVFLDQLGDALRLAQASDVIDHGR